MVFVQMVKVIGLKKLIREFGEGNALLGVKSRFDTLPTDHGADPRVDADGTQKVEHSEMLVPIKVAQNGWFL